MIYLSSSTKQQGQNTYSCVLFSWNKKHIISLKDESLKKPQSSSTKTCNKKIKHQINISVKFYLSGELQSQTSFINESLIKIYTCM